jgi:uncharacterized membrane protein YqjE
MAHEALKDTTLVSTLKVLYADVSDLISKEVRLAKAEFSERVSAGMQAGVWMAAAGFLGLIALLLVIQAIVFGIASFGIAMHWACLIVAVALAIIAAALFFYGRSNARETVKPSRTIDQIEKDIRTVRST